MQPNVHINYEYCNFLKPVLMPHAVYLKYADRQTVTCLELVWIFTSVVDDGPNVRLIYPHPKGHRCHDTLQLVPEELLVSGPPLRGGETGVVTSTAHSRI